MAKLLAMAFPILPGKTEQWRKFSNELKTRYSKEFNESRKKLGVQERTFLQTSQQGQQGDLVIVTLEGNDPEAAFKKIGEGTDEFSKWFASQIKEIHGVDMTQKQTGPLPELVAESPSVLQYA